MANGGARSWAGLRASRLLPLLVGGVSLGGLITYKASGAIVALSVARRTGSLPAKAGAVAVAHASWWTAPLADFLNYFVWIGVALAFGILLGAAVKALLPETWLAVSLGRSGARGQIWGAVAGTPLMLCSCCVAPVFEGAYARTRRLGPALSLMLAAPSLNPVSLALTFLVFPAHLALGRLLLALVLVLVGGAVLSRLAGSARPGPAECAPPAAPQSTEPMQIFLAAVRDTARNSLPAIFLGALASALLVRHVPLGMLAGGRHGLLVVPLVAALATAMALPTFAEIPIGLALRAAGAPDGVVLALLVAGPAINAPSLLVLLKRVSPRAAVLTALAVFGVATAGGLVLVG